MYNTNAMYFRKIKQVNRDPCGVLLQLLEIKHKVEREQWAEALDSITTLSLLPLTARSSIPLIRASAQTFNTLPPVLARTVGNLLMWTLTCCGKQRDILKSSPYEDRTRHEMADALLVMARDLMVFAGLIRYRMPARVFDALARSGQDVGVY
ncbi:MAG: hypothetical protein M1830_007600 [Pleopsidium flavum]|nr:MAG: hypothetical protein M1830_007600 [Pleopsidium flavum]